MLTNTSLINNLCVEGKIVQLDNIAIKDVIVIKLVVAVHVARDVDCTARDGPPITL